MSKKSSILKDIGYEFSYKKWYERKIEPMEAISKKGLERPLRKRKSIEEMEEKEILMTALDTAIKSGEYSKFVTFHSQYMYEIHSRRPRVNQRFLPWHRAYLVEFEEMLNTVMKREEPAKEFNIAFPYWDWEHSRKIPDLFKDFTPTMDVQVYLYDRDGVPIGSEIFNIQVKRFPDPNLTTELPNEAQVNTIREQNSFFDFAGRLEFGPHNRVHVLVGGENLSPDPNNPFDEIGAMSNALISPLDPVFWCHHANIDRIWAGWQKKQIEKGNIEFMHPALEGKDNEMHPWFPKYVEQQTRQIDEMGYTYDKL